MYYPLIIDPERVRDRRIFLWNEIEIATGGNYRENTQEKHERNAKYGWYRYDTYFGLPVCGNSGDVDHYNVFHTSLLIRHLEDGKKYLYDIIDIKKETSYPLEP